MLFYRNWASENGGAMFWSRFFENHIKCARVSLKAYTTRILHI